MQLGPNTSWQDTQKTFQEISSSMASMPLHSLLCLFLFFSISTSQTTIRLGSTLYASRRDQSWSSANSVFFLSFVSAGPSIYAAAVTYSVGIPVWSAGGAVVDSGGALHLLRTGTLRLTNGSGATVWDSGTANRGVSFASLDDSGNFQLLDVNNFPVWSSFDNPTDTLVPSQNFTVGKVLRSGPYSFSLLKSGNLTLRWNDSIVYWTQEFSSSMSSNLTSPCLVLQSDGILRGFDPAFSSGVRIAYSNDYGEGDDLFRFLSLDSDGNLRIYSASKGNVSSTMRWAAVTDQCRVYGYCGNLGICSYEEDKPVCGCPSKNFELVDANDSRKGCKRKVEIEDCVNHVTMLELEHTLFLTYPPELYVSSQSVTVGIGACEENCLAGGPSCTASTFASDGTGFCYMKTPDFVSGYQSPSLPSSSFLKVCGPVLPNHPSPYLGKCKAPSLQVWIFAVAFAATLLILVALIFGFWFCFCRNSPKYGPLSAQYVLLEYASGAPMQFSYKELQQSTNGFRESLGAGGFGAVYKGILANRMAVAVKQLEGIEQGEKQFRVEVVTISSTHHLNLVRLIGFCADGRHRLLVYEFMKNGSLDTFLFTTEQDSGKSLDWEQRFHIALGTARGITYLHEECRDCIVHCDIKPENILLDENYSAKVSDFGLAKLIHPKDQRHLSLSSIRGTRGYLAPEWLANLPITSKSDVYSYGMVLLEIISGRRNFEVSQETNLNKFSIWAYEEFEKGNVGGIIDRRLANEDMDIEQVMTAIRVSFWCIQEHPSKRPTMGKVVQMLEGVVEIEKPPAPNSMTEIPISKTSIEMSSDMSASSSYAASVPPPSFSSLETIGASSSISSKHVGRKSSLFSK